MPYTVLKCECFSEETRHVNSKHVSLMKSLNRALRSVLNTLLRAGHIWKAAAALRAITGLKILFFNQTRPFFFVFSNTGFSLLLIALVCIFETFLIRRGRPHHSDSLFPVEYEHFKLFFPARPSLPKSYF